jgi:predicted nucleic acid-binding protein
MRELADIVLAPAVVEELRAAPGTPGSGVPDLSWVQVRAPRPIDREDIGFGLAAHSGELETLALGVGGIALPVIDERPARRYAAQRGLSITGTLALLVDLHRSGRASRTVEEDLLLLQAAGMYLAEDLVASVIEQTRRLE